MENCFRFLINVDQCLNMSYFDMFFYKLESQHKFHMNSVQLFGDSYDSSLRNAISDIRMYLNKYPYHVGNYQIVVAMRSKFLPKVHQWEKTMLYRLLHMDHELRRAHILINSREQTEKALNLIMLYDSDFSIELPELGNYKDSARLQEDCLLLLKHLSLDGSADQDALEQALAAYLGKEDMDTAAAELLQTFLRRRRRNEESLKAMSEHLEDVSLYANSDVPLAAELAEYVRSLLFNFQIFEEQIDGNSRRQQTLALLRITEFLNMSTEPKLRADGQSTVSTLSQRCAANWEAVWNDPGLERRYADMLLSYRTRLNTAALELESTSISTENAKPLPPEEIPGDDAIACEDDAFSETDPRKQGVDLRSIFSRFTEKGFSMRNLQSRWNSAYRDCQKQLQQMEYALKAHAETMSRQYAAGLEKRKQDSIAWRTGFYVAGRDTEKDISRLEHERDRRLQQLKSPHMTPSLSFQDQLNMENALEQTNQTVQFYLRCLNAINGGAFALLMLLCIAAVFVHYAFLQPYMLQDTGGLLCCVTYLLGIAALMLTCWGLPYNHYRIKLKGCIKSLQESAEKYISGFYAKAEHFGTYINLLNQLDYITRYHRLLVQAYGATHKLSQGYLWHKVQIQQHLQKLQFFQGLMELSTGAHEGSCEASVPGIDGDRVSDYVDSPLYWPQG
ncbi:MAG: hypothetical protein IJA75_04750 [Oscillospiraceae bacterium]|nr:hypothetical protein [Oscillospiraceae bacterium]